MSGHRIVVIGSGFGGLTATKALRNAPGPAHDHRAADPPHTPVAQPNQPDSAAEAA